MASTFSDLKIELIGTGEQVGTWGITTNTNLGTAIEEAITGSVDVTFSGSDVTLTLVNANTTQAARNLRLVCTGTSGGARNLILGSGCQINKLYLVQNDLADTVTVKNTTGTGVAIPAGKKQFVFNNGVNVIEAIASIVDLTEDVTGVLPVANGGTGVATLTGIVKASGTSAFAAATAGTDYVAPGTATTFTALQSFQGAPGVNLAANFVNGTEKITVSATAATGTINYDVTTQSIIYYTSNASANWTVNFRGDSGVSLDTLMSTGQSLTVAFLVTQGAPAYYNNVVQVDGNAVTPKWQGGTAPTAGNASSIDSYVYTIVKTGAATFTVFAALTQFA